MLHCVTGQRIVITMIFRQTFTKNVISKMSFYKVL